MDKVLFQSILNSVVKDLINSNIQHDVEIIPISSIIDELNIFSKFPIFLEKINILVKDKNFTLAEFNSTYKCKWEYANVACNDEFYLIAA